MKKNIYLPILSCVILLLSQSCTKQSRDQKNAVTNPPQTINASVSAAKSYTLDLSNLGDVTISRQAAHFDVSQTETDAKSGMPVYKYAPKNNYSGTDEVELTASKTSYTTAGSGNGGCNNGAGYITTHNTKMLIKFTVSN